MSVELKASTREKSENLDQLRSNGFVPGVVYGKDKDSFLVKVKKKDLEDAYREAGESSIISIDVEGQKEKNPVLIYDVQKHPVNGSFIHIDFYQVNMAEKIITEVPLVFVGEAPAVTELDGILIKNMHELEIEALPKDLPHEIKIDISSIISFEDRISIKNLNLPSGVIVKADPEEIIVLAEPPRSEEELKSVDEVVSGEVKEVEVVGTKEKQEESEEEK